MSSHPAKLEALSLGALWLATVCGCESATVESQQALAAKGPQAASPSPSPAGAPREPDRSVALRASDEGESAAKATGSPSPCEKICAHSTELGCQLASQCLELCPAAMEGGHCGREMERVIACFLEEPSTSWECTESGLAAVKEGFCDEPQAAFVACMSR